jgi:molybdopterin converting factor small subunit
MRIVVPTHLQRYTDGVAEVEGVGADLAAVVADLDARFPGIRCRVVNEQGAIRRHMRFAVNGEVARELSFPVGPDDTIHIIAALSGG